MDYFKELSTNKEIIRKNIANMTVYMDNMHWDLALNMPSIDRDTLIRSYNRKVEKQNK